MLVAVFDRPARRHLLCHPPAGPQLATEPFHWQLHVPGTLPSSVRTVSSLDAFWEDLKTVLFKASFEWVDLECPPSPFTYSYRTICETRNSFINWTCRKLSHIFSSVTFNSETVLGFGWRFQNSFLRSPDTIYIVSGERRRKLFWRVIRWPLFLFKHLRIVLIGALLRDTCNAHRLLNLPLRPTVGYTLQWTLRAEINKQLKLLFATTLTLTLRHNDVIVV